LANDLAKEQLSWSYNVDVLSGRQSMKEDEARAVLRDLALTYVSAPDALQSITSLLDRKNLPSLPAKAVLAQIDQAQDRPFNAADEEKVAEVVHFFM
jgi:hypothetical protein